MRYRILGLYFACLQDAYKIRNRTRCKQERPRRAASTRLISLSESGAGEWIRTLDPNLGKGLGIDLVAQREKPNEFLKTGAADFPQNTV